MHARLQGTLWRNGDFLRLWSAQTVSQLGSQITLLALPFVAILVLKATTFEIAALGVVRGLRVLTTDRAWRSLRLPIKIEVIR